jgi:hypothetical protein
MIPLELAREALAQWTAATPGPWTPNPRRTAASWTPEKDFYDSCWHYPAGQPIGVMTAWTERDVDAIAAARTREPLLAEAVIALTAEVERLRSEINTPHTADFLEAVRLEAAHQRQRWAADHDAGKTDADWFWLIGWLAGKAVHASSVNKRLHHVITAAAALLNWHAALTGNDTRMRPGVATPAGEVP